MKDTLTRLEVERRAQEVSTCRKTHLLVARLFQRLDEAVQGPQHPSGGVFTNLRHDLVAKHLYVGLVVAHALSAQSQ